MKNFNFLSLILLFILILSLNSCVVVSATRKVVSTTVGVAISVV